MKIDAGHSSLAGSRPSRPASITRNGSASFSALMTAVTKDATPTARRDAAAPDFTSMTRQDLFDWMNDRIISGDLSLDDSTVFLGMTVRIPVGAGQGVSIALDDQERVDFVRTAHDGIAGARSRHDETAVRMLETAMRIMQSSQDGDVDQRP